MQQRKKKPLDGFEDQELIDKLYETVRSNQGHPDNCGLLPQHLDKAEDFEVHADKSVTFNIERHPHVLGHSTRGQPSSLLARVMTKYRWREKEGISVEDEQVDKIEVDEHAARVDGYDVMENGFSLTRDLPDLLECDNEKSARQIAKEYARSLNWFENDMTDFDVPPSIVRQYIEACSEGAADYILSEWEAYREERE